MRYRRVGMTALAMVVLAGAAPAAYGADTLVSTGSPMGPFSQNKQNEPALAVDAHNTQFLAAGANDEIDMESCAAGEGNSCPFSPGVGVSGIYFSFNGGHTWSQPTYPGYSARTCLGPEECTPLTPDAGGEIGTLPNYFENGLASDGDPALAFGPIKRDGRFSWANGARLYYANLTSSLGTKRTAAFRGYEALAVSYTDDPRAAAGGVTGQRAWSDPVIVTKQSSTTFSDKEQMWADNAASSDYFGNVYICHALFRSNSQGGGLPEPIVFSRSTDGGETWTNKQISSATANGSNPGRDGCTVRTDSRGGVYVYYRGLDQRTGLPGQLQVRSFDGGVTFDRPRGVAGPAETVGITDPTIQRPVEDGLAGARADLAPAPSVDIANGAPTGTDATDEILMAWASGDASLFHYGDAMYAHSENRGQSFSAAQPIPLESGDHAYYVAPALSPNGTDVYVAYNAFTTDYQPDTSTPRGLVGGLIHAPIMGDYEAGAWDTIDRGVPGDPRGSSQNNLVAEFLGDYVYAVGTRTGGAGVWNDVRNAADCSQVDAYRQQYENDVRAGLIPPNAKEDSPAGARDGATAGAAPKGGGGTPPTKPDVYGEPAPCAQNFGNSDIYGTSTIITP